MANLDAPELKLQAVSVTRKMAASLPGLRELAQSNGLKIHHLGAGYPHPEVTDPRGFLKHQQAYVDHLIAAEGLNDPAVVPEILRESYSYTDTLGPKTTRVAFAKVYGQDWGVAIDPDQLVPTVGASGGINLICSLFERPGVPVAYISDAPTYAGFTARVGLCQHACIFSVDMDEQGAKPDELRAQIRQARAEGYFVPFYYTVPDGHNPAGFSFSQQRREELLAVAREEHILIVEDAPYIYINYAPPGERAKPFLALAPAQTVHLFTGSKIGFPGPRVGFVYSEAVLNIVDDQPVALTEMAMTEASSDVLFQNPQALRGFEALLHERVESDDGGNAAKTGEKTTKGTKGTKRTESMESKKSEQFVLRQGMWPLAEVKLGVYRENRRILLDCLEQELGGYPEHFSWTTPQAGFFSVFTFLKDSVRTNDEFIQKMVAQYGVVVIPMYDFYPADAHRRNPEVGLNQLRLSFCFSESSGEARRRDMAAAVTAFCRAVKKECGLTPT